MSSPFELRFSCLNLAKDIQENHSIWSQNQAQLAGIAYTQPSADQLTASIIGTAHQLSLFINGDFDKLGLPNSYVGPAEGLAAADLLKAFSKEAPYVSEKFIRKNVLGEEPKLDLLALEKFPFLGIEGHVVVDNIYQPKALIKYAEYRSFAEGKKVIYVCDSLAAISELRSLVESSEDNLIFTVLSNLKNMKSTDVDLIIFDNCYNYNDLTLVLPTHRYKQVIVYRGAHCNPELSTDDYFSHFMVNTTMHLVGDKR